MTRSKAWRIRRGICRCGRAMERFRTEGDGFLWRQSEQKLTISNNVCTVFENGAKITTKP